MGLAPTRFLVSYERLLFYDTSVGLRLGYAFAGAGPTLPGAADFVPYSAELLARHWLGRDPFARAGPRVYLMVGVGAAQFDVAIDVRVREDPTEVHAQGGNDLEQTLRAWKRAGDGFVELGAGVVYPLGQRLAPTLELSACQTFPYAATIFSANAGIRVGLP